MLVYRGDERRSQIEYAGGDLSMEVITYSKEEALRLGHDFIGTEHLLLGMLRDGGGKAINILNSLEIDLDYLRKKVEILSPPNPIT